ncbi:helix-turn-helix transcriptional regulator [Fertoebacter nigrum]|uniref:Helix-turn-helix transcriptional regulator n=1 Tax=Fertoeibacter niger TaxID=2656921 RepID=A0A8X8H291_9RHOB|nr:metalloregulator ArsR/SmtB family transcription factor [Fertoeibacter niger]NUB44228.1 helix-turn-helix transcriptional regulator [Fertoeibacter niger]
MKIETAARQLDSLGNPTRLQIFRLLVRAGEAGMPVGALQARMGMAGSTLSHHLKRLIEAGLVTQERAATTLVCRASYSEMWTLIGFLQDECCADEGCASPAPDAGAKV